MLKILPVVILSYLMCASVSANLWQDISATDQKQLRGTTELAVQQNQIFRFDEARLLKLDISTLHDYLDAALTEGTGSALNLQLPLPNGTFAEYGLYQSPVMAAGLSAKYPEIRTFKVIEVANPANTGRVDLTPQGFHAVLRRGGQTIFIDPLGNNNYYQSYYKNDYALKKRQQPDHKEFYCRNAEHKAGKRSLTDRLTRTFDPNFRLPGLVFGQQVKTYRVAIATTGEYTQFHGGTKAKALASLATGINRINEVFERDLAVKLELIDNNDAIIYIDPATDPFDGSASLSDLVVNVINEKIGLANYDVGHVFGAADGGGQAGLGVICSDTDDDPKAQGESSAETPINDSFFIDLAAHEFGHQFGSEHNFNGTAGGCTQIDRSAEHSYEPGSGTTIMAYPGVCEEQDLLPIADPYFHSVSIMQIREHLDNGSGNTCGVFSGDNTLPTVAAGEDKIIPKQTPFMLTGSGSDDDGDTLTYTWEQIDLGTGQGGTVLIDDGKGPLFRSFLPTTSPTRLFPQLSDIINNTVTFGEALPTTQRELNFRLTIRDGKGGVASDDLKLQVLSGAGPFKVTLADNTSWTNGSQIVTWDVANTSAAPLRCDTVKIDLSTDNGASFPTTLLASTANDGSATVNIPQISTTNGRVRVSCTNQPFFAINANKIAISSVPANDNTPPVALNDGYSFESSGTIRNLDVLANDTDADNDALKIIEIKDIASVANPGATVSEGTHTVTVANDGLSINFKNFTGFVGGMNFKYTISDGTAEATALVTIAVTEPEVTDNSPTDTDTNTSDDNNGGGGSNSPYLLLAMLLAVAIRLRARYLVCHLSNGVQQ